MNYIKCDTNISFQTGDRILEVDGENLRNASHERAVEVIRKAGNPVKFIVQSLIGVMPPACLHYLTMPWYK